MRVDDALKAIDLDTDMLTLFYDAYMHVKSVDRITMIFYIPDYSKIPKDMLREHTGNDIIFNALYESVRKKLPQKLTDVTESPDVIRKLIPLTQDVYPHIELAKHIRSMQSIVPIQNMLMLTHCPLDLHLYKHLNTTLSLIESYTGIVKGLPDFGSKLIKESIAEVPFNATTHRILGDGVHIKPLISGRDRTRLLELAKKNRWIMKSKYEIIKDARTIVPDLTDDQFNELKV